MKKMKRIATNIIFTICLYCSWHGGKTSDEVSATQENETVQIETGFIPVENLLITAVNDTILVGDLIQERSESNQLN